MRRTSIEKLKRGFLRGPLPPTPVKDRVVERILDRRDGVGGLEYRIRWQGFTQGHDEWVPVKSLAKAEEKVRLFEEHRRRVQQPTDDSESSEEEVEVLAQEDIDMDVDGGPEAADISEDSTTTEEAIPLERIPAPRPEPPEQPRQVTPPPAAPAPRAGNQRPQAAQPSGPQTRSRNPGGHGFGDGSGQGQRMIQRLEEATGRRRKPKPKSGSDNG